MTTSEQRLHPASILFDIARYARIFAWPALIAFLSGPRRRASGLGPWDYDTTAFETWLWVLVIPSVGFSIVRYLTFRIRYEPEELVIRSGLLFRNVRHIPYTRIQNLDAVQNLVHRALGVVDVRVETGSGSEPEARLSVLPLADLDAMRARVFAGRGAVPAVGLSPRESVAPSSPEADAGSSSGAAPSAVQPASPAPSSEPPRLLLQLSIRDLVLLGLLENRGLVLMGALYGILWETGLMNRLWGVMLDDAIDVRGLFRQLTAFVLGRGPLPTGHLALALGGLAAFLVLARIISMAWAALRLYDFRLTRVGEDLRVTYGLFTRVAATIPIRRVQTVTVRRGWLARRLGRASIRVETAGGRSRSAAGEREWVAPIVRDADVRALLGEVLPGAVVPDEDWRPVHPRAFRRAVKPVLFVAAIVSVVLLVNFGWRPLIAVSPLLGWVLVSTRQRVRHLAWQASASLVAFRSGWLSQAETIVRANRVQSVTLSESLFDRRARMARVRVDTAGARDLSHRVDIPYLDEVAARDLQRRLAAAAARTDFQW